MYCDREVKGARLVQRFSEHEERHGSPKKHPQ